MRGDRTTTTPRGVGIAMMIIGVLLGLVSAVLMVVGLLIWQTAPDLDATAHGVVTESEEVSYGRPPVCRGRVEFVVDGQVHTITLTSPSACRWDVGDAQEVRYLASDPTVAEVGTVQGTGGVVLVVAGGLLGVPAAGLVWLSWVMIRQRPAR